MDRSQLTRIDPFTWEVPETYHEAMRVPVHILATDDLVDDVLAGEALQQAVHTAMLPGIVGHLVVMPDVYSGQGAPFGCVAATKYPRRRHRPRRHRLRHQHGRAPLGLED